MEKTLHHCWDNLINEHGEFVRVEFDVWADVFGPSDNVSLDIHEVIFADNVPQWQRDEIRENLTDISYARFTLGYQD